MNKLIALLFIGLSLFSNLYAKDLEIEKNIVIKAIVAEFKKPGSNLSIYQESENYRFDLSIIDLVDSVANITEAQEFSAYSSILAKAFSEDTYNFPAWLDKLKELANLDESFAKILDRKLELQLYNARSLAIMPEYKFIDIEKIKDLGLLQRVTSYNELVNNPEGAGLLKAVASVELNPYLTKQLTVAKFKNITAKQIKKITKSYYQAYEQLIEEQFRDEIAGGARFVDLSFRTSKRNGIKARSIHTEEGVVETKLMGQSIDVFNAIQGISHKNELLNFINIKLSDKNIQIPRRSGLFMMTPIFIKNNWKHIKEIMQEFTLAQHTIESDEDYLLIVRRWIKNNNQTIQDKIVSYNIQNQSQLEFSYDGKKLPSRVQTIESLDALEILFPTSPWISQKFIDSLPDFENRKGRAVYYDKTFCQKIGIGLKNFFRKSIKLESYTSFIAGFAILVATQGNASLALTTRSLVKKAVENIKYDRDFKEFLKTAPIDIAGAFLLGAGFSAGRLYKILALGAGYGALQSVVTGQDLKTGALVGAGLNLMSYYLLPVKWAKPMTTGYDARSLAINRALEIGQNTIRTSVHGGLVAAFTGHDPVAGAIKGGVFGVVSSTLAIWFLGTRYFPFKDYTDADIDAMINAENNFQNDVGRGGAYAIDRQMIMDANYRVNGLLPDMISASITLPGNVAMGDMGFTRLTTLTHEAHHLMQQHQTGVFGFYLFRYLPTSIITGYNGHPDENFLSSFLRYYLV